MDVYARARACMCRTSAQRETVTRKARVPRRAPCHDALRCCLGRALPSGPWSHTLPCVLPLAFFVSSSGPRQHRPLCVGVRGCRARHRAIGLGRRVGHLHHRLVTSRRRRARAAHSVEEPHQVWWLPFPSAVLPLRGCARGDTRARAHAHARAHAQRQHVPASSLPLNPAWARRDVLAA